MGAQARKQILRGIYGITDDVLLPPEQIFTKVESALSAGLALLQYRSKHPDYAVRRNTARQLLSLCRQFGTPLIINDDVALCADIQADGVHLGQSDMNLALAREQVGTESLIGITCHDSLQRALLAQENGADYVAFGRFFSSRTKPETTPADQDLLSSAKQQLTLPIVAIGGINAENGAALVSAGADMLAVVHALFGSENVKAETQKLNSLFD